MYDSHRIIAVMPAYNEARYVADAVAMVPRPPIDELIVVDDASTDGTGELARAAGAELVLRLPSNSGVGRALVHGWRSALARGADFVVVLGGDGQADVAALPRLLERAVAGADLVIGDRITSRDPRYAGMPALRWRGSQVLAVLTWLSTGIYVGDPNSGYQVLSRRLLSTVRLDELTHRWGTHNDMISHCALAGLRVATVPVEPVYLALDGSRIASHWRLPEVTRHNLRVQARALRRRVAQSLGRRHY